MDDKPSPAKFCAVYGQWRILRDKATDLIICDVKLPDGTFQKVVPTLKEENSKVPILVYCVQDWHEYLLALRAGAYDCIASPDHLHESSKTGRVVTL
jgi:DNA-binding NarL/FixJ family response regulator